MLKLSIFDMDGTVFESHLNWEKIKMELDIKGNNILKEVFKKDGVDFEKLALLEQHERYNTGKTKPMKGVGGFLSFLRQKQIKTALITNNNRENTLYLLQKFKFVFDIVVTREEMLWKPEPHALNFVMDRFGIRSYETISIGDSAFDVMSSQKADISSIFIIKRNPPYRFPSSLSLEKVTFFNDYHELKEMLKESYDF